MSLISLWKPGLSDDYSLRTLAGSSTEQFDTLENFIDEFAGVELAIIVVRSDDVMSSESQQCLSQMVEQVTALPAVDSAACIAQAPGWIRRIIVGSSVVEGLLVSKDRQAASIILQMRDDQEVLGTPRGQTVADLKRIVEEARDSHDGYQVALTGPYVLSYEMTHLVWDDLVTFGLLGAAAALAVLVLSLGSLKLASYPLLVGAASVALALGASVLFGVNTALNLPMLVLLTAVLTIANCVHLAVGHDETRGNAVATLRRLFRPCCGVVATTIVGFVAIGISPLEPVRSFALLMALGLSMGLVLSLAGGCISLRHHATRPMLFRPISKLLRATLISARSSPSFVTTLFAVLGLAGVALTSQLEFNLRFLDNFRPNDEVRTNYEFVQETLTPMQSIELLIDRTDGAPTLTPESLAAVATLAEEYQGQGPITRAVSVVDFLTFGGIKLPESQAALDRRMTFLEKSMSAVLGENPLASFVNEETGTVRVGFFAYEGPGATAKIELGDEIKQRAEELLGDGYRVRVTGLYYFYAHVARDLLRDQAISLALSVLGVFFTMAAVLRSWRMALLGMAPPLFAGASCVGLMVLLHVPFNTVTSMMLAVALGIAVDDTIHYLWRYRVCRRRGFGIRRALAVTQLSVGRACTLTSVVIAAGFAVMGFSRFLPIAYFGCVISVVMVIALAANLLLLPALLLVVDGWLTRRRAASVISTPT
ncbi:efflux RND transporter permease subunit [Aeoliella sp.]|uniref:efflux RND transporter permease subunit n=1 Tax=Aeoliella sp. TaxID=2795800 RepID=UPI003CCB8AC8